MGRVSKNKLAFLNELKSKPKNPLNKRVKKFIDSYIKREYDLIVKSYSWNFDITRNGISAFDKINEIILKMYSDSGLSFTNQAECDKYMNDKLLSSKIITKTINLNDGR